MKIIDCFTFFNELDLLEIRLDYLDSRVDFFVLVEAKFTQLGNPKELFYEINKSRYAKYHNKIIHIIVEHPVHVVRPINKYPISHAWDNENYQRNQIMEGLKTLKMDPDDIVIISDLDEIPSIEGIECFIKNPLLFPAGLDQDLYYYSLDLIAKEKWQGPKLVPYKVFLQGQTPQTLRNNRVNGYRIPIHGGWHFSYMGSTQNIFNKINSVCEPINHKEYYKSITSLQKDIDKNILRLKLQKIDIEKVNYPQNIIQNKSKYQHLIKS